MMGGLAICRPCNLSYGGDRLLHKVLLRIAAVIVQFS